MPALTKKLETKLNEQIANELAASHTYLAMAAYFDHGDLRGFAHWMKKQADEERGHAVKFYDHVDDRGGRVSLKAIEKPPERYDSAVAVFDAALEHEQEVTKQIYALYKLAEDEGDYALQVFLNWFVTEQVEEEQTAQEILVRLKRAGKDATALMLLDKELGARAAGGK